MFALARKNFALIGFTAFFSAASAGGPEALSPAALIEAEHWRRAAALLEPRLKASPNDVGVMIGMARCKEAAGDYEGALALALKAVALAPENPDVHTLQAYIAGRRAIRAGLLVKIGLARQVKKEAETALVLDPRSAQALQILIEFHRAAPGILGGSMTEAKALAERLVAIDPADGYAAKASLAHDEKEPAEVQEALYKKAVEADPKSYAARVSLAFFYSRGRTPRAESAEKAASEALALDPGRAAAYGILAQSLARRERWPDLDALLLKAEANVPDNLAPYYQAGRALLQLGRDFARAETYFRKYLSREPEWGGPTRAQTLWRLGLTLEKLGSKADAVEAIRLAVNLDPDLKGAQMDLKRLR